MIEFCDTCKQNFDEICKKIDHKIEVLELMLAFQLPDTGSKSLSIDGQVNVLIGRHLLDIYRNILNIERKSIIDDVILNHEYSLNYSVLK